MSPRGDASEKDVFNKLASPSACDMGRCLVRLVVSGWQEQNLPQEHGLQMTPPQRRVDRQRCFFHLQDCVLLKH